MGEKTPPTTRVAELGYSKASQRMTLTVPAGTTLKDLARIIDTISAEGIASRLPRGCLQCTSGDFFDIRERFEDVIRIDLDRKAVMSG